MRQTGIAILLLLLCAGCGNAEQRRQVERDQQAAAVSNDLRNLGQAMHDQQATNAAANDSTAENSVAAEKADAGVSAAGNAPVTD